MSVSTAFNNENQRSLMPKRLLENKNLNLHYESLFHDKPVCVNYGALIVNYLEGLENTINLQLNQYSKVFAVRVDLFFPVEWSDEQRVSHDYFSQFMDSLKAKLRAFNHRKQLAGDGRSNRVRFCRVIEYGENGRGVHIHAVLLFNGHVFRSLGCYNEGRENLYQRILGAWASALSLMHSDVRYRGLVNFSNGGYLLDRSSSGFAASIDQSFFDFSYLCKVYTKHFYFPIKVFSKSRR
ncbi:YagK/YfjJ domain-containing protein [Hydrogenovibrio marinus]|nr:inovirus-type Gp2 protein [Hydrogenovibrio marinus]BBN60634.1 hypothetical protein HVMH_2228 [Hydrogenovibrio marinus]